MKNRNTAKLSRRLLESMPSASRAPNQVNTTAPAAPAAATRLSIRTCWLYLRTAIMMVGSTMISAVPCASCCGMSISSTSAGIAISPPPMPSTPPMKPMRPPAARHSPMTNRFTSDPQRNLSSAASSRSTAQISRPSMGWRGALALGIRATLKPSLAASRKRLSARRGPDFAGQADFAERDQSAR